MKATISYVAAMAQLGALLGTLLCSADLFAQGDNLWTGSTGNWTDGGSWSFGDIPDPDLDSRAVIGSTDSLNGGTVTGVVSVGSDIRLSNPSPTIVLGNGFGTNGTLNISASGKQAVKNGNESSGDFETGLDGGTGLLNVEGTLEIEGTLSTATSANASSTITLSGSATLTAGSGFLDRELVIDGSNVSAKFTGDLTLGGGGNHTWNIPATGASTILVGGNADLGGTLKLQFPGGTPAVGTTWNLVDSATVDANETPGSGFGNIDQSTVGVVAGQKFVVNSVAGGFNGLITQLALEQHPVLVVDRATGTTSIQNFGVSSSVDFDVYTIGSGQGTLNQAGWTSMAPTSGWVEANASSNALSELNVSGSQSIAGGGSIALGSAVSIPVPTVFGQDNEDVTFRFAKPTDSTFTEGTVIYTGVPNSTLTLNVDPNTGEAQIVNGTAFTVSIDAYVISSGTDSLETANGTWNSLDDQGTSGGNWHEANASLGQLSELLITGGMELAPNAMISLGTPFDSANGFEDLDFQFALVEDSAGDFDLDGDIDGQDFLEWQRNPSVGNLADWQANYGAELSGGAGLLAGKVLYSSLVNLGGGGVSVVPEPTTGLMLLTGLSLLVGSARRRKLSVR